MGQGGQKTHQSFQEKYVMIMVCQLEDTAERRKSKPRNDPHLPVGGEAGGTHKDNQAFKSSP